MPVNIALRVSKRILNAFAYNRAIDVLPDPGGPQSIIDNGFPVSMIEVINPFLPRR